ncbi:DUF86 domain-containing protein [Bacteroidia bacterium]|nr:DUF86 domain-containing protein [Bacteroidia bacterium]
MYDKELISEMLQQLEQVICSLLESTKYITDVQELPKSADGMLRLNGICMSLLIIGEEVNKIDQRSNKQLLSKYPSVPWKNIVGMRNKIVHDYSDVDVDIVFDTLRTDIVNLLPIVKQIQEDIK